MQTVQRYLINNLVIAYISGYHGGNTKVYDRRLTLHRGVSNPITFTFKNEDQKAQDITAKTYELNVIDTESKKSVITKTLTILDDGSTVSTKGDASTTITEGDLLPLDSKFYNFAVREVKADGSREVTYADTGYSAAGTIELLDGAYPEFTASTSITNFTVTADAKSLAKLSSTIDARPGSTITKHYTVLQCTQKISQEQLKCKVQWYRIHQHQLIILILPWTTKQVQQIHFPVRLASLISTSQAYTTT